MLSYWFESRRMILTLQNQQEWWGLGITACFLIWEISKETELKESFSHFYSLGHHLCLKALCHVCMLGDVTRKLGNDSIRRENFKATYHCYSLPEVLPWMSMDLEGLRSQFSCLNTGSYRCLKYARVSETSK